MFCSSQLRRVNLDARLAPSLSAELVASADVAHFNARTASWEPVIEPWDLAARYVAKKPHVSISRGGSGSVEDVKNNSSFGVAGGDMRPSGTTVQVAGTTPLRLVVTNAFAEDVMRATSRGGRAGGGGGSSVSKNGLGSVNATGAALWVTRGGSSRRTEILPGEVIPNVGDELGTRDSAVSGGSNGRSTSTEDAADPTYLLVEILESDGIRKFEREDDGAKAQVPPPKEAFALALAGTFRSGDGLGASSLPAGATRGAALVDLNADGLLDIYVRQGGNGAGGYAMGMALAANERDLVYLGREDGHFDRVSPPHHPSVAHRGRQAAAGDADEDGLPDLAHGGEEGSAGAWLNRTELGPSVLPLTVRFDASVSCVSCAGVAPAAALHAVHEGLRVECG